MKRTGIIIGIGKDDAFFGDRRKLLGKKITLADSALCEQHPSKRGWYMIGSGESNLFVDDDIINISCFHQVRIRWDQGVSGNGSSL